ncbi:Enoyl-CoA hydratase / carnithine racemase [Gordonia sp. KTR9]|nr:enoyl-CoA hydratase-related protein [Gordonia sp. KTR9]AFR49492.1 Enoyl-CoA hydratase / carnithine racemase [Gordonia sp. KTR9]
MTESVVIVQEGHTLVITINRPEVRNAVDMSVCLAIGDALEDAEQDRDIRTVVLTGAGEQAFCSGADLKAIARGEPIIPPGREAWGLAGYVNHPISKPTIAAVNGLALGGGTELALASDLIVASENAVFGLPEVKRGRVAGAGGAFRWTRQLPERLALELLLTGGSLSAEAALEHHLVNRVVPADRVRAEALLLADAIGANGPVAVQATKRIAKGISDGSVPAEAGLWEHTAREAAAVNASDDAREGLAAFAEKRAPQWTGR